MDIKTLRRAHLERHVGEFRTAEDFLRSLNDRLQELDRTPVSSAYLSQLRVGPPKGRNIGDTVARKLEKGLGLETDALDHPIPAAGAAVKDHQAHPSDANNEPLRLPVISSVAAGQWRGAANPLAGDADDWEVVTGLSRHAFVLRVEGDSMTSQRGGMSIPNGAKVAVEPNEQPEDGSIVVAKLRGMKAVTIKKLVVEPPYNFLMPLNELYDRISVTEDCHIVGVVKKVIQDLR